MERYKALFAAKSFHQQHVNDFIETFSPVIKSTTIRYVLHVALNKSSEIHQLDVNNTFLQGTLNNEVYVAPSQGFDTSLALRQPKTKSEFHMMHKLYTKDLLDKTNILHTKPVATPMFHTPNPSLNSGSVILQSIIE